MALGQAGPLHHPLIAVAADCLDARKKRPRSCDGAGPQRRSLFLTYSQQRAPAQVVPVGRRTALITESSTGHENEVAKCADGTIKNKGAASRSWKDGPKGSC
jgi:hypothetical protein